MGGVSDNRWTTLAHLMPAYNSAGDTMQGFAVRRLQCNSWTAAARALGCGGYNRTSSASACKAAKGRR